MLIFCLVAKIMKFLIITKKYLLLLYIFIRFNRLKFCATSINVKAI